MVWFLFFVIDNNCCSCGSSDGGKQEKKYNWFTRAFKDHKVHQTGNKNDVSGI